MQKTTMPLLALEAVLLEYIEKYGLTDTAKQYFESSGSSPDGILQSPRVIEPGKRWGDGYQD